MPMPAAALLNGGITVKTRLRVKERMASIFAFMAASGQVA